MRGPDDIRSRVSIAIPVYNGGAHLRDAITSALHQTQMADEVLVFDNASTDDSVAIARSLLPAAAVRTSSSNIGASGNFNRAATESSGAYFAWLAADDCLFPRFVDACVTRLEDSPQAAACLPAIQIIDADGSPQGVLTHDALSASDARTRIRAFLRRPRWTEVYGLYRRSHLLRSPMFRNSYGADVRLTWWFLLRGPFEITAEPLLAYRVATAKSAAEMSQALLPNAPVRRFAKARMWRDLWRDAGEADVAKNVRRVARRELLSCLLHRHWMGHLTEDVLNLSRSIRSIDRLVLAAAKKKS